MEAHLGDYHTPASPAVVGRPYPIQPVESRVEMDPQVYALVLRRRF